MKTAIVTTLRNADATLHYFVGYHLSIGFDHLFLFFDDPNDPGFAWYKDHPAVTAIKHDAALRKEWLQTRAADRNYAFADREVMARQLMNADLAVQMALFKGIKWLLHIDADELFYSPNQSVTNHFGELSAGGIEVASYLNLEAIPESSTIQNFFTDVSLFKRNRATFTPRQLNWFRYHLQGQGPYFNFYDNGKAAGVVTRLTQPMGVHSFEVTKEPVTLTDGPIILHFPCCGFDHFLTKYQTLGRFSDRWFNRGEAIHRVAPVHSQSRDVVLTGDETNIRAFYEEVFVRRFDHLKDACLYEGIFTRIQLPTLRQLTGSSEKRLQHHE
jgi:hypothetical protein